VAHSGHVGGLWMDEARRATTQRLCAIPTGNSIKLCPFTEIPMVSQRCNRTGCPVFPLADRGAIERHAMRGRGQKRNESLLVLRNLRNQIAHTRGNQISWEDAMRFQNAADRIIKNASDLLSKKLSSLEEINRRNRTAKHNAPSALKHPLIFGGS
jgi:hypothetical protein